MSRIDNLKQIQKTLAAAYERKRFRKLDFVVPYPKQQEFLDLGSTKRERLFMAGNQLGKSYTGAFECATHLTGLYPNGWLGRTWGRPVNAWAAGESSTVVRDVQQRLLCGPAGVKDDFGTGLIPKKSIVDVSLARGVTDAYDTIQVKRDAGGADVSGGISTLKFKSYEQGRAKFQGDTIDFFWGDEEPPLDVYGEMLTRITATKGMGYITFTPLKGMSEVVMRFLNEPSDDRAVVTMTIDDALHIPPDERAKIIAGYPAHEREARAKGIPMLGSGRIFTTAEDTITEPAMTNIPLHWAKLWCIDFGIEHNFAAVLLAWDRDFDTVHVIHAIRVADQTALQHAAAMKPIAVNVPVAWPQDGHQRDKGNGQQLASIYKKHGLQMLPMHAQFSDGSRSTEAAIMQLQERMNTGRFKVAAHLSQWFEEYRMYHRKDGKIVQLRDDLLSATQKGIMMLRFAKPVPLGGHAKGKMMPGTLAHGHDFNVFG